MELLKAKKHMEVTEAGEDREESSLRPFQGRMACQHCDFLPQASRTVVGSVSVTLGSDIPRVLKPRG